MRKKKIISIASIATILIAGFSAFKAKSFFLGSADQCIHEGYHYASKEPSHSTKGWQEFWTCCKCHQAWLSNPSGTFLEGSYSTMSGGLSSEHIAYIAPTGGQEVFTYNGYYDSLESWTDSDDLLSQLRIISQNNINPISYSSGGSNWFTNQTADQALDDFESVDVVYSPLNELKASTNTGSTGWQREHALPAILMTGLTTSNAVKTNGIATDFHNLFASFGSGNTSRGEKNYGEVNEVSDGNSSFGDDLDGYKSNTSFFEPGDMDKGRLSRAILYMVMMYDGIQLVEEPVTVEMVKSETNPIRGHGNRTTIINWATTFPVDRKEYQHNESVYSTIYEKDGHAQGNRNPFVDYPNLVDYCFGDLADTAGNISDLISSYETLEIESNETNCYAIKSAKRSYLVGETLSNSDIEFVTVSSDFSVTPISNSISNSYTFTDEDALNKKKEITVNTSMNSIKYIVNVDKPDFAACNYQYTLTGKASGGDLETVKDKSGQYNDVTFGGTSWQIYWEQGSVANKDANKGVAFGAGTSSKQNSPIKNFVLQSKDAFSYDGKTKIKSVYFFMDTASGTTLNYTISIGGTQIDSGTVIYDKEKAAQYGITLSTPLEGQIKLSVTNINNGAFYLKTIGVQTID